LKSATQGTLPNALQPGSKWLFIKQKKQTEIYYLVSAYVVYEKLETLPVKTR